MDEKLILIVGAGLHGAADHLVIDHLGMTAPLEIGPRQIDIITIKREEPIIPDLDFRLLREPKKRDWEQRERGKRRRR